MKVNFKPIAKTYIEIGQPNPLRWIICKRVNDKEVEQVSNLIRCKDFFNDFTYTIQTGKNFSIYGFNANEYSPPKKGENVYFAVKHLFPEFYQNMEFLNKWLLEDQKFPTITAYKQDNVSALLVIPGKYFENTYYTSLVTLLIRLMNTHTKYETFKDVKEYNHHSQERTLLNAAISKNWWFAGLPEKGKKYVWYQNQDYNSDVEQNKTIPYGVSTYVHNNGLVSWSNSGLA